MGEVLQLQAQINELQIRLAKLESQQRCWGTTPECASCCTCRKETIAEYREYMKTNVCPAPCITRVAYYGENRLNWTTMTGSKYDCLKDETPVMSPCVGANTKATTTFDGEWIEPRCSIAQRREMSDTLTYVTCIEDRHAK